jgi:hypothetical protein
MKKKNIIVFMVASVLAMSCGNRRTSVTLFESDRYFSMEADFNERKTKAVEAHISRYLGEKNNFSFSGTHMDALLTLDDHTSFRIKKLPGHVEIKLDKTENSSDGYRTVKTMCEDIRNVIR